MNTLTLTVLEKFAALAINKASRFLLDQFDETNTKLDELNEKVEAFGFQGEYRTACDNLAETTSLTGRFKTKKLESSMHLFEVSGNRMEALLKYRRDNVNEHYSIWGQIFSTSTRNKLEYEVRVFQKLRQHLLCEKTRVLCLIGALRAATELEVLELIQLKKASLLTALSTAVDFVEAKKREMFSDSKYKSAGPMLDLAVGLTNPSQLGRLLGDMISSPPEEEWRNKAQSSYITLLQEFKDLKAWCDGLP